MAGEHNHSDLHTAHVAMRTCVDYSDISGQAPQDPLLSRQPGLQLLRG